MWISVDRYLAARKPLRYETIQTKTRCQCWMAFTWISSAMMCCPPLLGWQKPLFDKEAYICMLDWGNMAAFSATLSILILGPSLITIIYTYAYIFAMMRKLKSGVPIHDKEYATALSENLANPSHIMSFVLVCAFWFSWTPYMGVKVYEYLWAVKLTHPFLHFGIVWIGFLNCFWKSIILVMMSPQFRLALRIFCMTICCRYKGRMQAELIGMEADDWLPTAIASATSAAPAIAPDAKRRSAVATLGRVFAQCAHLLGFPLSLQGLLFSDYQHVAAKLRTWCHALAAKRHQRPSVAQ